MATNPRSYNEYTVGWVCALPKEQTAARAMLDEIHPDLPKPATDENTYTLGSIRNHNVVIACLPKHAVGTSAAARVATQMFNIFPIKIGLMVGIGGGIPPKVRLGDVVVSTEWIQWDFGKVVENGKFQRTGKRNNLSTALLTAISKLETQHEMYGTKILQYLDDLGKKYPNLAPKYTSANSLQDPLGYIQNSEKKTGDVCVHYGLIASGNQVIKNAEFRDELNRDLGGDILCFEMEAAGLTSFPYIVIRGICDYADSQKNDDWQKYAAAVAAAYAKELLESIQPIEIDRERPVKDLLGQVFGEISTIRHRLDRDEDLKVLDWLTPIDYGPQHSDFLSRRQPGSGQWVLDSTEYQTWVNASKQILFCPGIPGAGKTIITSTVTDHLITQFSNDLTVGIAFIYCNFKRKTEQNLDSLLASLLKQLAQSQNFLPENVKKLYDQHSAKRTRPSLDDIVATLKSVASLYSRVFIIVDALDECQASDNCRAKLLTKLFQLYAKCGTNIFATSRFIPEITDRFRDSMRLEILAHDDDVRSYLDGQISQSEKAILLKHREDITTRITEGVRGMFLLAQLHFESIRHKNSLKKIKNALNTLPTGDTAYDGAYENAMKRIDDHDSESRSQAHQVLSWIACAKRPLTTSELQHALAVEVGEPNFDEDNLSEIKDIISLCAGLVTVDEESNIIRLIHYTTQEYFQRTWEKWFPNAHTNITERCVTYLLYDCFKAGVSPTDEDFEAKLQASALYDYAARNWGHHARRSSVEKGLVLDLLKNETAVLASIQAMLVRRDYSGYSQRFPNQMTGVHLAAYFGLQKSMGVMLDEGVDIEAKDGYGRTPLWLAAELGHEEVARLLVDKGADLEAKGGYGRRTPLLAAAEQGHEGVARLLVDRGADLEAEGGYGRRTPLLAAAELGHEGVARLLVDKGADLEAKSGYGRTPLLMAVDQGREGVVRLLVDKGADLEAEGGYGQTPLWLAAEMGHEGVVRLLVDGGADLEAKNADGDTPLLVTAWQGHEGVVRLLVDRGADLEAKAKNGDTPLLAAVERGHEGVVRLLVDKGVSSSQT
ncbi:hypothetical protein TWF970_000736 [Orbilia oligospora]|uniref:Uncharacterized protein n=1 Tax=Orbilia oligospora TaxID=2813651 RepID=A0A7C8RIM3_ORBOL|nr:hypothetical protein TWF970_000736 [Orbilia oligospora]